jgi:hypothetical protein
MAQLRPKRNYGGGERRADRQHAGAHDLFFAHLEREISW